MPGNGWNTLIFYRCTLRSFCKSNTPHSHQQGVNQSTVTGRFTSKARSWYYQNPATGLLTQFNTLVKVNPGLCSFLLIGVTVL